MRNIRRVRQWLGLHSLLVSGSLLPVAGFAYGGTVSSAETLISVDQIVSPYSQDAGLSAKRDTIISLIVGSAVEGLESTCRARNNALAQSGSFAGCPNAGSCPDMEIHVFKRVQTMSLNGFFATTNDFSEVGFGFTVSWSWGNDGGVLSTCYAPAIHPVILDLRQSLLTDPFLINRVRHTNH